MTDIFGKLFGIILAFILCFLAPFMWVTLSNEMVARRTILNEMQAFIDEVIDSRKITDDQLEDFYLGISGMGPICDVEIERYVRVVSPAPEATADNEVIYVSYMYSEDITKFNQGDKVKVTVKAIDYTGAEKFIRSTIGLWMPDIDMTLAARVR